MLISRGATLCCNVIVVRGRIIKGRGIGPLHVMYHHIVVAPHPRCILPVGGLVSVVVVKIVAIPTFGIRRLEPNLQCTRTIVPGYPLVIQLSRSITFRDGEVVGISSGIGGKVSIAGNDQGQGDISRRPTYLSCLYSEFLAV